MELLFSFQVQSLTCWRWCHLLTIQHPIAINVWWEAFRNAERKLQRVQEDRAIIRALLTSTGASDQTTMLRTCLLHTSPTQVFLPAKLRMGMIV